VIRLSAQSGTAALDSARVALAAARTTVAVIAVRAVSGRGSIGVPAPITDLLDTAASRQAMVLVSLGSPYVIRALPHVTSYLLGWSTVTAAEQAVAAALTGGAAITGRLPVSIPPRYPLGQGLFVPPAARAPIPTGSLGN
jgi:beta-N-acetylhexosaminidase